MDAKHRVFLLELGTEPYDRAWELQHRLVAARRAGRIADTLLLLEHEPVITIGRHGNESNIRASAEQLAALGIGVRRVERGGDVTYHGPGQLVGYPIMRLADYGLGASDYMHLLEEVLIKTVADFGVDARRREGIIGVWTKEGKIAALGARIEEGITYHGFALNVNPAMAHFQLIVPCGLRDDAVASMAQLLGHPVDMAAVRLRLREHFAHLFRAELQPMALADLLASGQDCSRQENPISVKKATQ